MKIYYSILLFIYGTVFGSFFRVVGDRLSNNESIISPGSHCSNCKHSLKWYELIPILSYLIQGGRCRVCKIKLSITYPLTELLTGILFLLSYLLYGFSYNMCIMLIISSLLIIIFVSDFNYLIIPDEPLIIGTILVLIITFLMKGTHLGIHNLLSGIIMFIFMYVIKLVGDKTLGRESLGGGDIKLSFFMGSVLGFKLSYIAIVIGSVIALPYALWYIVRKKEKEVPYGPFLILGTLIAFVFSVPINNFLEYLIIV